MLSVLLCGWGLKGGGGGGGRGVDQRLGSSISVPFSSRRCAEPQRCRVLFDVLRLKRMSRYLLLVPYRDKEQRKQETKRKVCKVAISFLFGCVQSPSRVVLARE